MIPCKFVGVAWNLGYTMQIDPCSQTCRQMQENMADLHTTKNTDRHVRCRVGAPWYKRKV